MKLNSLYAASALLSLTLTGAYAQDTRVEPVSPLDESTQPREHEPQPGQGDLELERDAGHDNFSEADMDSDGVLSVTEARATLPQFIVEDIDADGFISQAEAESALPELKFKERGREGGDAPVSETEFGMIVIALNERDVEQSISTTPGS